MTTPHLKIKNATLYYNEKCVFKNLHFDLAKGKWTAILGQSGIGKSSLLRMIAGLIKDNISGTISTDDASPLREQIAYMGQTDLLLPWQSILKNTLLSFQLRRRTNQKQALHQATQLLIKVGLGDAINLYPHQLSLGMRQRAALVRTLLDDKPIILMDEPFSALDAITRYKLQGLAAELLADKTVLFITHDPNEALRLAHFIFIMYKKPAVLKQVVTLQSPIPREVNNEQLVKLQTDLFHELLQAVEAHN